MSLSIHDNLIISYEVQCEGRTIMLRTVYRSENEPTEFTNVIFTGVQGYSFENDAFGNIILDLETVPAEQILAEYGSHISKSYNTAGSPGPWAADLALASKFLHDQDVQGFILSSLYGLSGWVLARSVSILPA